MFAPLTHFNASLFWDGALKRQTHFSFPFFGPDTVLCASESYVSGLNFSLSSLKAEML